MSLCVATVQATYAIDASGEIQALHDNRPFSLPCQALRKLLGCRQTSWAAKGLSGTLFGSPAAVGPPCAPASGKFSGAITSPWTFGRSLHCCVCWRNGLAPPRSSPCEARAFERSSRKKFSLHRLEFALKPWPRSKPFASSCLSRTSGAGKRCPSFVPQPTPVPQGFQLTK